jgi:hypothetical protein
METWLAGVPVLAVRGMLSSLARSPELQSLIEECWSNRGNERRYTVPTKTKRELCQLAVAHDMELRKAQIRQRRAEAAERRLRSAGYTDAQIAQTLSRMEAEPIYVEPLDLEKVLRIMIRRAPEITLRRKASARKLRA